MADLEEQRAAIRIQLEKEMQELEMVRGETKRLSAELMESRLNSSSPPSPTTTSSLSTPHPTLLPFRDNPALRKMASTYLLSEREQAKIKRKKADNRRRSEEESKATVKDNFEVSLLTAHMNQTKASTTASLISLMCKATESESISDYSSALSWYRAVLAYLKASDPNEINKAPIFRAHMGVGDNLVKLERLGEAEAAYEIAVKVAKEGGDKKGLEEAAERLGKTLMRHSEEMETQGLTQEAYIALQRGIMSLEDAVDGKVGKYREEIDALSPSEKIMFEDQRNRNIEKGGGGGKTKRGKKGKTQTREGKSQKTEKNSWKVGGKASARSINVDLYASGMLPSPRVLQAPPYQPRRISLLQPRRRAGDEQRARKEAEEEILKGYYGHRRHTQMTPSQQIRTFEETEERKKVKKEEEDKLKYAVRRGKHLFVKRGGAQYVDALTEGITITEAAVRIQSAYRSRKARQVVAAKKLEDSIPLWSVPFAAGGCPLIAVFSIIKEPVHAVLDEELIGDADDHLEYNVYERPSKILTKEEKLARLYRSKRAKFALEMLVYQPTSVADGLEEAECVLKCVVSQAELQMLLPGNVSYTRFEHLDLSCQYSRRHMETWLPLIARRVVVKEREKEKVVGDDEVAYNRDISLEYRLKLERTAIRTGGRVGWGPKWRAWYCPMYFQVEFRVEESVCLIRGWAKQRRHEGVYECRVTAKRFARVMGYLEVPTWRSTLESMESDPVAQVKQVLRSLRLVNTVVGPRLIVIGDETLHQLVMWPEEKDQFRREGRSACAIQRRYRGVLGRRRANHRRLYRHMEDEGRRRLAEAAMENKKRSSAAVVLQASVKRGLARKRADAIREIRRERELEKRRERERMEYLDIEASKCQRIVRGGMGRRRALKRRLEARADEMEKKRLYEAAVILEGTALVIEGKLVWEGRMEEEGGGEGGEDYRSVEVPVENYR
ncbi:hypothetical protein TrRE_jg11239 [Triparma retinervis]|uniref:Uncharacterized protein n=1 Tax=Triparma retinervis TaxID=2557542 RepID=A0A9W7E405_9STRA|nr:hypothetical protein TrRE_jg11239 [Triparma retinervis]